MSKARGDKFMTMYIGFFLTSGIVEFYNVHVRVLIKIEFLQIITSLKVIIETMKWSELEYR